MQRRSAAPDVVPIRPAPLFTLDVPPFVVPSAGAWQLVPEVFSPDEPCPPGAIYTPSGFWVRYTLRNLDTGEKVTPAGASRSSAARSL